MDCTFSGGSRESVIVPKSGCFQAQLLSFRAICLYSNVGIILRFANTSDFWSSEEVLIPPDQKVLVITVVGQA